LFLNFEKNGHRKWKKLKKIDFEIWIEIWKFWNMSRKFEMKNWNFSFFKIWNFHFWNLKWKFLFNFFLKKLAISPNGNEKNNWNEEIIYFVYATEIKLPIIPLYHPYHLCIAPYTTCASCGGIQLILVVGSFHTNPFPTVVWGGMVHHKRALINHQGRLIHMHVH
jgi:hypothetical protein